MNKHKKCFLLLLVLLLMLTCICSVSASELDNNTKDTIGNNMNITSDTNIIEDNNYLDKDNNYDYEDNEEIDEYDSINDTLNIPIATSKVSTTYSYNGILKGANQTSNYIKTNYRLPTTATVDNKEVDMNNFLYLMCKSLNQTNNVTINQQYTHTTTITGTNSDNTKIYKKEYLILANNIIKCYDTNKRDPKNIKSVNNQTMSFDDTVYFYARAVAWKYNHEGTLPNYGTVIALYNNDYSTETNAPTTTSTQPFTINTIYTKLSNGNTI